MTGGQATSRRIELTATADSAAVARRFVASVLRDWSLDALVSKAQMVVSELVTNAVLHAGIGIACGLSQLPDGVRVEVHDGAAGELLLPTSMPSPRPSLLESFEDLEAVEALLLAEATTGRGLQVVNELAADWGADPRADGKVVWALICPDPDDAAAFPEMAVSIAPGRPVETATSSDSPPRTALTDPPGRPVRFIAVPVRLALQSDLQLDALIREFQVMGVAVGDDGANGLVRAAREILDRYSVPRSAGQRAARAAFARGDRLVDVTLIAPDGAGAALRRLLQLLHEVDRYCRSGQLLALAAPAELQAFRLWYVEELERQFAGEPPAACPFPVEAPDVDHQVPDEGLDPAAVEELIRLRALLDDVDSTEDIARLVLAEAVQALGAERASVCLVGADRETVDIVDSIGYAGAVADHWSRFPLAADLPASETIRTGTSIVLRTVSERNSRYPVFASTPALEDPSFLCIPLGDTAPARGALVLNFARSRDFRARELRLVEAFCDVAADAFDRVAANVERAHRAHLARITDQLLSERGGRPMTELLPEVAVALSRELFDYCIGFALRAGEPELLAAEHRDATRAALADTLHRRWPPRLGVGTIGRCLSTGELVIQQVVPPEILPSIAESPDQLALLRRLDVNSTAVAPIAADDGSIRGALAVANQAGRFITDSEIDFLRGLARRLGEELDRG